MFVIDSITECWDDKPSHSSVNGLLKYGATGENRPEIFYFGQTTDIQWCKEQCAKEPLCYVYNWHQTGDHWHNQCHGRGFGARENLGRAGNIHCGVKLC